MNRGIAYTGIPSNEELSHCPGFPSQERMKKGRVAIIECIQNIPCNPCEAACPMKAIHIGDDITALPHLDEAKCIGCSICLTFCPGIAITVIDKSYSDHLAQIDFPYEFLPLPHKGDVVDAVGRDGQFLCLANVISVSHTESKGDTPIISMELPIEFADEARSMKRLV